MSEPGAAMSFTTTALMGYTLHLYRVLLRSSAVQKWESKGSHSFVEYLVLVAEPTRSIAEEE